jgi:macrodomain Ter protein organizer (MatP/YcbG family)
MYRVSVTVARLFDCEYAIHMRRTQLYLDEQLWEALHARARLEKATVSDLVRQAVRERYLGDREQRRAAMRQFVGIRRSHAVSADSTQGVRRLRRGSRLDRLSER